MKKSISKETLHTNAELKRYLGALHEEHMDGLKAMGEQFVDVNRKLDSHTEMIGGLAVRMTNVEEKMGTMEGKVGSIEMKVCSIEMKVGSIEMKMAVMQEDIEFIKSGLKRKVDQEEFDALIRRVSVLERRVLK